jgi:ABC-2 type transport system ATP-binding protein
VVTGVQKRFGSVVALSGIDLVLRGGSVTGLVGPNGSGKSTLLGVVAGLVRPDSGVALVAGHPAAALAAAKAVAFVPDEPSGFDEITVNELLLLLARLHRVERAERRRTRLIEAFALAPLLGRRLGELSRGQRRRSALVAALQLDTPLLVVDEATATLDAVAVEALASAVGRAAARGGAVLLASHDEAFIRAVTDDVVTLAEGRIVERRALDIALAERCGEPSIV